MTKLVPYFRKVLCDTSTALGCYIKLNHDARQCFLFESVQGTERWARYSFIGLSASEYYTVEGYSLKHFVNDKLVEEKEVANPLKEISKIQKNYSLEGQEDLPRFCGGLVGYFGYESVRYVEPRLAALPQLEDNIEVPDIYLLVCRELVVYDNLSNNATVICLYPQGDQQALEAAKEKAEAIADTLLQQQPAMPELNSNVQYSDEQLNALDGTAYMQAVEKCREYIFAGDAFQIVPSHRASYPFTGDVLQLYRALRLVSPSPYMYLIRYKELDIIGASPETMARLENGVLTVRPIAGTAPRGRNTEEDQKLANELLANDKERAEHNMLVDLARNDLGRVSEIASVNVSQYMQVENFSHVMHLVSTVSSRIVKDYDAIDALCATLPAGTLSGAPKIRAMEIINELEPVKRCVYSGAIGYLDWQGNMDTAIPIRTFVVSKGKVHIQAGGGIVADSVPEVEWQETLNKRRGLFRALEMVRS